MKEIKIVDITPGLISGVIVQMPSTAPVYKENWFEWTATTLQSPIKSNIVVGGILKAWTHTPVFTEMETHIDAEMFYFVSGTAIMPFADFKDDKVDMDTLQIVRIPTGTQIIISANKAHFVAVAEGDTPYSAVIVAPVMDAPRTVLPEIIMGIQ